MFGMFSQILSKIGVSGSMVAIDNVPPFMINFWIKPERYDDDFSAEFSYATYPGGRYQYPIFRGNTPRTISFTLRFDISRQPTGRIPSFSILEESKYKGSSTIDNFTKKMAGLDYINRMRSIIEKLKLPKTGLSEVVQNAVGSILKVNQGTSEPSPPLVLLIRNINKMYLGYLSEGKIRELLYDENMICTRISVECKFLVAPDLIFTTFEDVTRELNIWSSGLSVF